MATGPAPVAGGGADPRGPMPPPVALAAQQYQLGPYLASQRVSGPTGALVGSVAAGVGLLVLGFALLGAAGALGTDHGLFWVVRGLAGASCLASAPVLAAVIRGAAQAGGSSSSSYLFDGGLIHLADGRVEVIPWPEVRAVHRVISPAGTGGRITHVRFVRRQGWPTSIPLQARNGSSPFADHLLAMAKTRGITIADAD
jgi:hypothetical protein